MPVQRVIEPHYGQPAAYKYFSNNLDYTTAVFNRKLIGSRKKVEEEPKVEIELPKIVIPEIPKVEPEPEPEPEPIIEPEPEPEPEPEIEPEPEPEPDPGPKPDVFVLVKFSHIK